MICNSIFGLTTETILDSLQFQCWLGSDLKAKIPADSCVGLTTETILDSLQFNVDLDQIWEQKSGKFLGWIDNNFVFQLWIQTTKTIHTNVDLDQIW